MNTNDNNRDYAVRELSDNELAAVSGGFIPVPVLIAVGVTFGAIYSLAISAVDRSIQK